MVAANTTTNFNFNLTDFNKIPWHIEEHNNWHIIDALMARFLAISSVQGAWENALAVTVGQRYIDVDSDTIYEVLVTHTTPSTGTFAVSRTAMPANWQTVTVDATSAIYTQNTAYTPNTFLTNGARYGVAVTTFTSDNAAATTALSYDADVASGNVVTLFDVSTAIVAAHDTNVVATGGTPTAVYDKTTGKFDFGLVTGATGATGAAGSDGADATGDLEATNNLSDVANASTSRTNLGLAIGSDVQAHDADTTKNDVANVFTQIQDLSAAGAYFGTAAAANLLDDYEEGIWTPTFIATTNDHTYSNQLGFYTKIGDMVFVQGRITVNSAGTTSGNTSLGGLPFSSVTTTGAYSCLSLSRSLNLNLAVAGYHIGGYVNINGTMAILETWDTTGGTTPTQFSEISAGADMYFQITYKAG